MATHVLIVDDEPSIAMSLEFIMEKQGYETHVVGDGAEALRRIEEAPPDVVLLDVMLPTYDGFEVCRRIRERDEWADLKVLMITAKGREEDVKRGLALGANGYVTKPFAIKDVVAKVEGLLT
jgi:DNA-binding response OmpR family regulator